MVEKKTMEKLVEQVMEQFSFDIKIYKCCEEGFVQNMDYAGLSKCVACICVCVNTIFVFVFARRRMSPGSTPRKSSLASRLSGRQESSTLLTQHC